MEITIDIETVPTQRQDLMEAIRSKITAPGQYKKPESIAKWLEDNGDAAFDTEHRKTALSGTFGEIICICWAIDDQPVNTQFRKLGEDESEVLTQFFTRLDEELKESTRLPTWIGHNILGFDLRFIWHRAVINNIKIPFKLPYDAKPWNECVYDTLYEWNGSNKAGGSLDKISKALGYEGKGEITGSNVWDYVKEGKENEVAEYCKQDVILTRNIYNRMKP